MAELNKFLSSRPPLRGVEDIDVSWNENKHANPRRKASADRAKAKLSEDPSARARKLRGTIAPRVPRAAIAKQSQNCRVIASALFGKRSEEPAPRKIAKNPPPFCRNMGVRSATKSDALPSGNAADPSFRAGEGESRKGQVAEAQTASVEGMETQAAHDKSLFSETEEAFFQRGKEVTKRRAVVESFEDLDEGLDVPKTFWERLRKDPTSGLKTK